MSGKKTNEKMTTPIVIAISAVLVIVVIVAVALVIHLRKTASIPNNTISNRNASRNTIVNRNELNRTNNNSNKNINNTVINNNIVNNVVTNNTAINNTLENNNIETNTAIADTNTVVNNEEPPVVSSTEPPSDPENINIVPIKPNIKGKETIQNGELIYINDYKITIPSELIKIGYEVVQREDVVRNKSKGQFISMYFNAIVR